MLHTRNSLPLVLRLLADTYPTPWTPTSTTPTYIPPRDQFHASPPISTNAPISHCRTQLSLNASSPQPTTLLLTITIIIVILLMILTILLIIIQIYYVITPNAKSTMVSLPLHQIFATISI